MNSAQSFSADYDDARLKFCRAVNEAEGALASLLYPEKGPKGQELFTDVALFGRRDSKKFVVLIAGTHGVEGFCGSGAMIDLLRRGELSSLPDDVGVVMIHAINPYGFAWLRRVTHENIDLNRNWIDFTSAPPHNPGYDVLSKAICPNQWTSQARAECEAKIETFITREGDQAWHRAITGGQYTWPKGVFYGGAGPSWSRQTQTKIFRHYLSDVTSVAILDFHTGQGPWGFCEQIIPSSVESPAYQRAARWYGNGLKSMFDGATISQRVAGDGLSAAEQLLPSADVTALGLEFGTVSLAETYMALRADAWLHAHGDPTDPEATAIKAAIRTAYYGDRDDWKGMIVGQSLTIFRQAIMGLATS